MVNKSDLRRQVKEHAEAIALAANSIANSINSRGMSDKDLIMALVIIDGHNTRLGKAANALIN